MPHLFDSSTNRRRFLQTTASAAGAILATRFVWAGENTNSGHWALLSDTHIPENIEEEYRGFRPYENLKQIVPNIAESKPAGAVVTGDIARLEGLVGDYQRVKELLEPLSGLVPSIMALGNHDDRANFLTIFSEETLAGTRAGVRGKHVVVIEQQPVRLIVLDSLFYVNKVAGLLGKAQRDWLARYLKNSDDTPTMMFVHHTLDDGDGDLLDVPRLFDMLDPAKKVKAIVFGHSHVYDYKQRDGMHLINLPAVGYSFNDKQPIGWVEADLTSTGASLCLHAIGGNTASDGEVTELEWR